MDTQALRNEHSVVLILVSRLGGLSHRVRVKDDAEGARAVILDIDALLHNHLAREDALLYPALRAAPDDATRTLGAACSTEMGGLIGAWASYRSRWTVAAILSDTQPVRFGHCRHHWGPVAANRDGERHPVSRSGPAGGREAAFSSLTRRPTMSRSGEAAG
ncbi:MAG: hypothetical protein FD125_828 [bacterium]|nr:MAG: hypothetical protein FD125_828 [bacterium]